MPLRHHGVLLAAAAVSLVFIPLAASSNAGATSACSATAGVTVVVDFSHFGGGIVTRCAPSAPESGLAAMQEAGFQVTPVARYGYAFICKIDGWPANASCTDTPPANAYWAYYLADGGDTGWTYSTRAVTASVQKPGSREAWAFGADARPPVAPNAVPPPPTGTPPTATTKTTPPPPPPITVPRSTPTTSVQDVHPAGGNTPIVAGSATNPNRAPALPGAATTTTTTPSKKSHAAKQSAAKRSSTTTLPSLAPDASAIVGAASPPTTPDNSSSGTPWPLIATLLVLAGAATGAVLITRARRRQAA